MSDYETPDLSANGTPVDIGGQIFAHRSVMLEPCMDALAIKPDGIYVDTAIRFFLRASGFGDRDLHFQSS